VNCKKGEAIEIIQYSRNGFFAHRMMMNMSFQLMAILILVGLAAIFIIQNVASVEVRFLFWSIAMSRALLIVFALVIGFVSGWIVHGYLALRRSKKKSEQSA
jgi:lipopolysaccharide assembly protein A